MLHGGQISFQQYRNEKMQEFKQEAIKNEAHQEVVKDLVKKIETLGQTQAVED